MYRQSWVAHHWQQLLYSALIFPCFRTLVLCWWLTTLLVVQEEVSLLYNDLSINSPPVSERIKMEAIRKLSNFNFQRTKPCTRIISSIWHLFSHFSRAINRPLPSSKNPHFQNEARCTTFLVKMSFICMRMKNGFHIKGWAPTLVLKQRPGGTRKGPINNSKEKALMGPEKTNFKSFKLSSQNEKMKSYAWRFYLCFLNFCEIWNIFSRAPIRNCLWCYYRWLITSIALEKCKKECDIV